MIKNKLIIAAAGSGKTTHLIDQADQALKDASTTKILITTFTQDNESEIRRKIIEKYRCMPSKLVVQTWFSFLLKHGVKPFQGVFADLSEEKIKGLLLVNGQSAGFVRRDNYRKYYFTDDLKIYSDKLSEFVCCCNKKTKGAVLDRISRIYSHIFIDEVQDLAGWDFELIELFSKINSTVLLVGDPRQKTYTTHNTQKNKKKKNGKMVNLSIDDFIKNKCANYDIDQNSLTINYRCNQEICDLANQLFPEQPQTQSGNQIETEHRGVFFVKSEHISRYLQEFNAVQLRYSSNTSIDQSYEVKNFGESKGLSFDRVLIYPTEDFMSWIKNSQHGLASMSRSKFYVAITRARHSVGIVKDEIKQNCLFDQNSYPYYTPKNE